MDPLHRWEHLNIGLQKKVLLLNTTIVATLEQNGLRLPVMTRRDSELLPEPVLLQGAHRRRRCRKEAEERTGRS